jgi:taurine dioxygenase
MYAAYESLSSKLQRFIDELDAVHDATASFGRRVAEGRAREDASTDMTRNVHPVVAVHPVSGRKALFVNRVFTEAIEGMSAKESGHLLELLFQTVHVPDTQVRLRWRPGTVAMWDNRCTQHYAVGGYTGRRVMQRVTFLGPEPKR